MYRDNVEQRAGTIRHWVKRRRDRGQEPNADSIWSRIEYNWPGASESEKEYLFQRAD